GPAQIEVAVAEAVRLAHLGDVVDRVRRRPCGVEHPELADGHFDRARRQLDVDRLRGTGPRLSAHRDHVLEPHLARTGVPGRALGGVAGYLHEAAAVAQIVEEHAPVVAARMHPTAERHRTPDGRWTERAARVA